MARFKNIDDFIVMKIFSSYYELSELVSNNTGKSVKFEFGGCKEDVIARIFNIPIRLRILQVEPQSITVSYRIGGDTNIPFPTSGIIMDPCPSPISFIGGLFKCGAQVAGNKALNILIEKCVKHPAVCVNEDKSVTIDLDKVPQMKAAIAVNAVSFDENGAIADVTII